jgi:non-ribosomal peptide synthetase component F
MERLRVQRSTIVPMESEMADSLIALHNHLAGAYSRRYSTSIRPRAASSAEPPAANEPVAGLERSRMVVLLTAWSVLVSRIADQDRLLIGVHTGGRMLPVRMSVGGTPSSNELMEQCRRELAEAERAAGRGFAVLRFQFTFGPTAAPEPPFQLHVHANIAAGRLSLRCNYSPSHFTEGAATVILEQYRALLEAMAADPDRPVNCLIIDQAPPGTAQ